MKDKFLDDIKKLDLTALKKSKDYVYTIVSTKSLNKMLNEDGLLFDEMGDAKAEINSSIYTKYCLISVSNGMDSEVNINPICRKNLRELTEIPWENRQVQQAIANLAQIAPPSKKQNYPVEVFADEKSSIIRKLKKIDIINANKKAKYMKYERLRELDR